MSAAALSRQVDHARGTVAAPMPPMRTISVKVPEDLAEWIERVRTEEQAKSRVPVTTSDAVRIILEDARGEREKRPAPKPRKR